MAISLDAIYQPLNQFFLQKFGQPEGAPVFFRFAEVPVGIHDTDFVVPSHPELGSSPALAVEQLSNLVDKITRLDATGHGVWLDDASRISDLYHDEILEPSLPLLSDDLDSTTKQQVIDSFSQVKSDAVSRWENSKTSSLLNPGSEFRSSTATPQSWWNESDSDVWTHQDFQIQGAATGVSDQPTNQLLRMKISDEVMQSILIQHASLSGPAAAGPVASAPQPPSWGRWLQRGRPIFAATTARANAGPQAASTRPAAQPIIGPPVGSDSSVAMHNDLMLRLPAMPLNQRIQLQSVISQNAPTQSVTVSDVTISFDYCLVSVARSWIQNSFLNNRSWFIPGQAKGSLSANDGHGIPALPTGFIALKNLSIKGPWTPDDINNLEQSIQFGPFLIDSTVVNGAIGHMGIQVVGWMLQDVPDLPPLDAATQKATSPSPPADASSSPACGPTSSPSGDGSPSQPSGSTSSSPGDASSASPPGTPSSSPTGTSSTVPADAGTTSGQTQT